MYRSQPAYDMKAIHTASEGPLNADIATRPHTQATSTRTPNNAYLDRRAQTSG
jgi:hypothetical protein